MFWKGALEHLSPDVEDIDALLDDLLQREFLLREPRSSISGETAYRFKHLLIREVAYTGLAKLARAQHHARFAEWLAERTGEELVEIRAYHLDQAVELLVELEGAPPEELAQETAAALVKAAKRAIAREAYATARKLGLRALELRPTLGARYVAARAAWRLQDWAAVQVEMVKVRDQAREQDEPVDRGARADRARRGDAQARAAIPRRRATLVDEALELLARQDDPVAHFDALTVRAIDRRLARRHGRGLRPLHGARVRDRARRGAQGPADDRRAGARADPHRAARARRGRAPAHARARARRRERQRARARGRDARLRRGSSTVKGELDAAETAPRGGPDDRRASSASSRRSPRR